MKKKLATFTYVMLLMTFLGTVGSPDFQSAGTSSVEGIITNDTVWILANSPYEVLSDVTIADGVRLTIEPGVKLRFVTGSSLIVNGSLYAVGNSTSRISFTSVKSQPAAGDWNGIKLCGDESSTVMMSFCDVEYAKNGITADSRGKVVIETSNIAKNSLSGIHAVGETDLFAGGNIIKQNAKGISGSGLTCSGMEIVYNYISNNENGVYLFVYGNDCRINNVTISDNALDNNVNGIHLQGSAGTGSHANAYINNVRISDNLVRYSEYGIRLLAQGWGGPGLLGGGAYIYNSVVSGNNISFSSNALHLDSSSEWFSWISNLTISGNKIHSSDNGIFMHAFRTPQPPYLPIPFDVILVGNTISANNKSVSIFGDVSANFSRNSISYNSYGIYLNSSVPSENVARNNDIYRNTAYGLCVLEKASIDAEHNYWGASSGPYHETLWPSGKGDIIYGENLDLTPFLTKPFGPINDRPFALLKADKTTVAVNQTLIFDGSESSDDSSIINFFFDFGDGETMEVFSGVVRHEYTSPGTYNVSLVVMDDLGVNSTNRAIETITVAPMPSLVVSVFASPLSVFSEGKTLVEVYVEVQVHDEVVEIEGAFVTLVSDRGGSFEPPSGYTDSNGDFKSNFSVPSVSEPINMRIVATASKEGYEDGSYEVYLPVLTRPGWIRLESPWIWFVAIAAVVMVAIFLREVVRRKLKAKPRGKRARA